MNVDGSSALQGHPFLWGFRSLLRWPLFHTSPDALSEEPVLFWLSFLTYGGGLGVIWVFSYILLFWPLLFVEGNYALLFTSPSGQSWLAFLGNWVKCHSWLLCDMFPFRELSSHLWGVRSFTSALPHYLLHFWKHMFHNNHHGSFDAHETTPC